MTSAESSRLIGRVVRGHGVASGRSDASPYPAGTIAMQAPVFRQAGLDLSDCWPGTVNLSFAPLDLRLKHPDHCFQQLHWTDLHPPETFSFWRVILITESGQRACGWIYLPHPETKQRHWQSFSTLEVLAPFLHGLAPNSRVEVVDDRSRIALVDGVRLRSRLLEFLKFRVLAAQQTFFSSTEADQRRAWLEQVWPEALALDDAELEMTWSQARSLYAED
jgi:hypothetical protein